MSRKALAVSVACVAVAACLGGSLIKVRASEPSAATALGYPSASTQIFDATPLGGELRTFGAVVATPSVQAQIFDPEALGTMRSNFSGIRSMAGNAEASQSTLEGRSVATPVQPVAAPIKEISPQPPRECAPRPSAGTTEPQFGSLEQSRAVGQA